MIYFLKVIELFEQFGYYDFVVELAKTALDVCDAENPNKAGWHKFDIQFCILIFSLSFVTAGDPVLHTVLPPPEIGT